MLNWDTLLPHGVSQKFHREATTMTMFLKGNIMALRNQAQAPAFESEELAEQPSPAETKAVPQDLPVAPSTGTAVSPLTAGTAIKQLQNAIPTTELENLGIGVFPRITVGLDGFSRDKTKELGKKIAIEVLSWSYVWLVTAGEQNEEANRLIRTSYDGKNLKGGEGSVTRTVARRPPRAKAERSVRRRATSGASATKR